MEENDKSAVSRRAGIALGLATAGGVLLGGRAEASEPAGKGMVKVTALYGTPKDPVAFEKHYNEIHMPMVYHTKGIARIEIGKPQPGADGQPAAFYRITELWFKNVAAMKAVTSRPDWQKIVEDVPTFASGGATVLITVLD